MKQYTVSFEDVNREDDTFEAETYVYFRESNSLAFIEGIGTIREYFHPLPSMIVTHADDDAG